MSALLSNHMPSKVWDEITYPFLNFHPTFYNGCNYLSMLGLKLNHVIKRGPRRYETTAISLWFIFTWYYFILNAFSRSQIFTLSCFQPDNFFDKTLQIIMYKEVIENSLSCIVTYVTLLITQIRYIINLKHRKIIAPTCSNSNSSSANLPIK